MRIAMVGTRGIPTRLGGAERVVEQLARHLVLRGHEVLVYCRRGLVNENGNGNGNGHGGGAARLFTPHWSGKHVESLSATATAVWDLLRRGVDVVHVHSPGPAMLSWLPAAAGRAVVFTVHAPDWRRDKWSRAAQAAIRGGLWCGMKCATEVTAVSSSLAGELERQYHRPVRHVPNAAPACEPAGVRMLPRWGLRPGRYLLHVGRIVPEKRLDLLLRSWDAAAGKAHTSGAGIGPDGWKLVVTGQWDDSRYGRACRAAAGKDVLFLGPRHGLELAELYTHAGAVVQPSVLEGMSLVLLEAAAYGRCVLAADIPANREVLGEAAWYIQPDDAAALAGALGRCMQCQDDRVRLGEQARRRAAGLPTWAQVARTMERVYEWALAEAS